MDTSFGFAIGKLLATKSHRVWVLDERERAIGVVSITDVMRAFAASAGIDIKPQRGGSSRND